MGQNKQGDDPARSGVHLRGREGGAPGIVRTREGAAEAALTRKDVTRSNPVLLRPALMPERSSSPTPLEAPAVGYSLSLGPTAGAPLTLARACYLEASFSFADCRAIVGVLRTRARRAHVDVATMAWRYSALDADNDRARFARELPAGDLEDWNAGTNRLWAQLRQLAARALAGRAPTPCAGATHWGGPALERDAIRAARAVRAGRWRRVTCSEPVANAFYAELPSNAVIAASIAAGAVRP